MEVQDIFTDLEDPEPDGEEDQYSVCIHKLYHHFRSKENVPIKCHNFRQLAPTKGETVDKFLVRLKQQARHCNFGPALADNLRDQLIEKIADVELKKLLETRNVTLEAAMQTA